MQWFREKMWLIKEYPWRKIKNRRKIESLNHW
jgi:hypothetical protein